MTKDWVHGVGHSPVCQNLLQIVMTEDFGGEWVSFSKREGAVVDKIEIVTVFCNKTRRYGGVMWM